MVAGLVFHLQHMGLSENRIPQHPHIVSHHFPSNDEITFFGVFHGIPHLSRHTPCIYIYVCIIITQNGCSLTEYGQGCLNFASATFHDVKIPRNFSIPKIRNYRRYHPQMVALRQWLSHMIHPLGHPWAIPWAKPKPRSRRSTLEH